MSLFFSLDVNRYLDNYLITVMDKLFKALNDPTRREILVLLRKKDMNAGEIAISLRSASRAFHITWIC